GSGAAGGGGTGAGGGGGSGGGGGGIGVGGGGIGVGGGGIGVGGRGGGIGRGVRGGLRALLVRAALDAPEPDQADHRQGRGDVGVQAQAEEVRRGVDAQRFLEDPVGGVAEHVQREQARRLDLAVVAEPDQHAGPGEVEDQLVQEHRLEGAEVQVLVRDAAGHAVLVGDLQAPRQRRRAAEELLVEVVTDPADALRHQQG